MRENATQRHRRVGASALDADHATRPGPYGFLFKCRSAPRVRSAALGIVTLTMLTSCAVGPDFQVPVPPALKGFLPGARESVPGTTVARGADIYVRRWRNYAKVLKRLG